METLKFKKYDSTKIDDVNSYVKEWINEHPFCNIIIGCDSQQHSRYVKYAVVICLHDIDKYGVGHGAHCIYADVSDKDRNMRSDIYSKLWKECEYAVTAAKMIEDCGKKITIHLDYNSKKSEYSNVLYESGIGFAKGMGFEALGKPFANIASIVSDKMCR